MHSRGPLEESNKGNTIPTLSSSLISKFLNILCAALSPGLEKSEAEARRKYAKSNRVESVPTKLGHHILPPGSETSIILQQYRTDSLSSACRAITLVTEAAKVSCLLRVALIIGSLVISFIAIIYKLSKKIEKASKPKSNIFQDLRQTLDSLLTTVSRDIWAELVFKSSGISATRTESRRTVDFLKKTDIPSHVISKTSGLALLSLDIPSPDFAFGLSKIFMSPTRSGSPFLLAGYQPRCHTDSTKSPLPDELLTALALRRTSSPGSRSSQAQSSNDDINQIEGLSPEFLLELENRIREKDGTPTMFVFCNFQKATRAVWKQFNPDTLHCFDKASVLATRLLEFARSLNGHVDVIHMVQKDITVDAIDGMEIKENEPVVQYKPGLNPFYNCDPSLIKRIKENKTTTIIFAGARTSGLIRWLVVDAVKESMKVVVAYDACSDSEHFFGTLGLSELGALFYSCDEIVWRGSEWVF